MVSRLLDKSFLAVSTIFLKGLVYLLAQHFQTAVNKINNVAVNYSISKFQENIADRTKCHMRPACLRPYCTTTNKESA